MKHLSFAVLILVCFASCSKQMEQPTPQPIDTSLSKSGKSTLLTTTYTFNVGGNANETSTFTFPKLSTAYTLKAVVFKTSVDINVAIHLVNHMPGAFPGSFGIVRSDTLQTTGYTYQSQKVLNNNKFSDSLDVYAGYTATPNFGDSITTGLSKFQGTGNTSLKTTSSTRILLPFNETQQQVTTTMIATDSVKATVTYIYTRAN